ncbi:hypothetical protein ACR820_19800 [Streptomyces netropsis]
MTTQTQHLAPVVQRQGSHFFVLTLERAGHSLTQSGTYTPPPGTTREDAFTQIHASMVNAHPDMGTAVIAFFALEPNQL